MCVGLFFCLSGSPCTYAPTQQERGHLPLLLLFFPPPSYSPMERGRRGRRVRLRLTSDYLVTKNGWKEKEIGYHYHGAQRTMIPKWSNLSKGVSINLYHIGVHYVKNNFAANLVNPFSSMLRRLSIPSSLRYSEKEGAHYYYEGITSIEPNCTIFPTEPNQPFSPFFILTDDAFFLLSLSTLLHIYMLYYGLYPTENL